MVKTAGRINPCTGRRKPLTINVCSRIGRVPGHVCKLHPVIRGIAVSITYRHLIAHRTRVINRLLEGYAAPIVIIGNIYPILCLIVTYGNRSTVFLKLSRLLVRHGEEGHRLTDRFFYSTVIFSKFPHFLENISINVIEFPLSVFLIRIVLIDNSIASRSGERILSAPLINHAITVN